jgi:hypothetical protein
MVPPPFAGATEEYDGNSWTSVNPMNTARYRLSRSRNSNSSFRIWWCYTVNTAATEEYNGTSWATSPGSLNTARRNLAGAGTQTAALAFGGAVPVLYRSNRRI